MMNPEIEKRSFKSISKKFAVITAITFILLMLGIAVQIIYAVLNFDGAYGGIYINNVYVGNISFDDLGKLLNTSYRDKVKTAELTLKCGESVEKVRFSNIKAEYDINGTINRVYNIGRSGNIFKRLHEIMSAGRNGIKLHIPVSYNKKEVENIVNLLSDRVFTSVKDPELLIQDDSVMIRSGHSGKRFDKNKVLEEIEKSVEACKGGLVEIPVIKTPPTKIDVEDYYKKINREVTDAAVKIEYGSVVITPQVIGRSMEKSLLISIASELDRSEDTEKILPVEFIKPKLTAEEINARLFKDTLATAYTWFSTRTQNDKNRGNNIRIAVSRIDGAMVGQDQVFSFNGVVGQRTEKDGFKIAHTYVGGKVVDGVGGGICQVSTTLYNSALFSDLEVVERANHMFTVAYVPLGRDAAVSYGQVDFKFKNSTNWPVRIDGNVTKDNQIIFSITGTDESPEKTVEINSKAEKTADFTEKYIDDPTLEEGKLEVNHEGSAGYIVDTFKIIKLSKKVVSETKIHTSIYKPLDKEIRRGTKRQPGSAPQPQKVTGVDDADNPPAQN